MDNKNVSGSQPFGPGRPKLVRPGISGQKEDAPLNLSSGGPILQKQKDLTPASSSTSGGAKLLSATMSEGLSSLVSYSSSSSEASGSEDNGQEDLTAAKDNFGNLGTLSAATLTEKMQKFVTAEESLVKEVEDSSSKKESKDQEASSESHAERNIIQKTVPPTVTKLEEALKSKQDEDKVAIVTSTRSIDQPVRETIKSSQPEHSEVKTDVKSVIKEVKASSLVEKLQLPKESQLSRDQLVSEKVKGSPVAKTQEHTKSLEVPAPSKVQQIVVQPEKTPTSSNEAVLIRTKPPETSTKSTHESSLIQTKSFETSSAKEAALIQTKSHETSTTKGAAFGQTKLPETSTKGPALIQTKPSGTLRRPSSEFQQTLLQSCKQGTILPNQEGSVLSGKDKKSDLKENPPSSSFPHTEEKRPEMPRTKFPSWSLDEEKSKLPRDVIIDSSETSGSTDNSQTSVQSSVTEEASRLSSIMEAEEKAGASDEKMDISVGENIPLDPLEEQLKLITEGHSASGLDPSHLGGEFSSDITAENLLKTFVKEPPQEDEIFKSSSQEKAELLAISSVDPANKSVPVTQREQPPKAVVPTKKEPQPIVKEPDTLNLTTKKQSQPSMKEVNIQSLPTKEQSQPSMKDANTQNLPTKERFQPTMKEVIIQNLPAKTQSQPTIKEVSTQKLPAKEQSQPTVKEVSIQKFPAKEQSQSTVKQAGTQNLPAKGQSQPAVKEVSSQKLTPKEQSQPTIKEVSSQKLPATEQSQSTVKEICTQKLPAKDQPQPIVKEVITQKLPVKEQSHPTLKEVDTQKLPGKHQSQPTIKEVSSTQNLPVKEQSQSTGNQLKTDQFQPTAKKVDTQNLTTKEQFQPTVKEANAQNLASKEKSQSTVKQVNTQNFPSKEQSQPTVKEVSTQNLPTKEQSQPIVKLAGTQNLLAKEQSQPIVKQAVTQNMPTKEQSQPIVKQAGTQNLPAKEQSQPIVKEVSTQNLPTKEQSRPIVKGVSTQNLPPKEQSKPIAKKLKTENLPTKVQSQPNLKDETTQDVPTKEQSQPTMMEIDTQNLLSRELKIATQGAKETPTISELGKDVSDNVCKDLPGNLSSEMEKKIGVAIPKVEECADAKGMKRGHDLHKDKEEEPKEKRIKFGGMIQAEHLTEMPHTEKDEKMDVDINISTTTEKDVLPTFEKLSEDLASSLPKKIATDEDSKMSLDDSRSMDSPDKDRDEDRNEDSASGSKKKQKKKKYYERPRGDKGKFLKEKEKPDASLLDEETRMDANLPQDEDSQGSTSKKEVRRFRCEVIVPESTEDFTADKVVEYVWPLEGCGEHYFIQEQISQYLGIMSFKRKYPDMRRRPLEMQERDYLREKGLVSEMACDLGLTAVRSEDVLDVMLADFPSKFEELQRHLREQKESEMKERGKVNYSMANLDKSKMQEYLKKAAEDSARWNAAFNREKREDRRYSFDLQTYTLQMPHGRQKKLGPEATRIGAYPVVVLPGQYTDYYREYSPSALKSMPLNTVLCAPQNGDSLGSDGAGSDSDDEAPVVPLPAPEVAAAEPKEEKAEGLPTCKVCSGSKDKNKSGNPEPLIICGNCRSASHPTCIDLTLVMVPKIESYNWQCMDCKSCVTCSNPDDEDKMIFCDMCDRGYHIYCVGLRRVPNGRWHCKECAICASCGSKTPAGAENLKNAEWQHEFKKDKNNKQLKYATTLCVPCDKYWKRRQFCYVCLKVYRSIPEDGMVRCSNCPKYIHREGGCSVIYENERFCTICYNIRNSTALNHSRIIAAAKKKMASGY